MKSKTQRKSSLPEVVWPTTKLYFSIEELNRENPAFKKRITLRVRLTQAIQNNIAMEIGTLPSEIGRPYKLFALCPVSELVLQQAEADGVTLTDRVREKISQAQSTNLSKILNLTSTKN